MVRPDLQSETYALAMKAPRLRIATTQFLIQFIAVFAFFSLLLQSGCEQSGREVSELSPALSPDADSSSDEGLQGRGVLVRADRNDASNRPDEIEKWPTSKVSPPDPLSKRQSGPSPRVPTQFVPGFPSDPRPPLVALQLADSTLLGVPIGRYSDLTFLMRNDGTILSVPKAHILKESVLQDRFQTILHKELAQQLREEYGKRYSVKQEHPYLIVAAPQHIERWADRFRTLHHSVNLYCSTHGIPHRPLEFPLVAIVFATRVEFLRAAKSTTSKVPDSLAGFYSIDSNRIYLYESIDDSTEETLDTICHEAAHQLAFNMGLHQRRAATPLWIAEGFATMFESPKLSGFQNRQGKSLWPTARRMNWHSLAKTPKAVEQIVSSLVRNDKLFESDAQNAYTVAWAMTVTLSQRRSPQFSQYLQRVAHLPPFETYESSQRWKDFQGAFGSDVGLLTNSILKYLDALE